MTARALAAWWRARAPREQRALAVMLAAVALALLWFVAVAPAWRIVAGAPARIDAADAQWQRMQRLAAEVRTLRTSAPVGADAAGAALQAATARLGDKARLSLQGDRAVLTLRGVDGSALREWLAEVRAGARARAVQADLTRAAGGLSGTVVVALGGAS
ncbi:MAG TPA: type II secretion system protein GspM [Rubrivivax sp.]|nr:type II secretion system protein GspM [Rubrivivax sp.]HPP83717.1 type II secretion system protein GspM [Rubrivivax sp.]